MHVHAGLPWGLQPDHGHLHRKCTLAASPVGSRCIFEAVSPFRTELACANRFGRGCRHAVLLFFFSWDLSICNAVSPS